MFRSTVFSAIVVAIFVSISAKAQSNDAGISTHNYKHPNKAAKATKPGVRVATIGTIESYYKRQNRGTINTTPKYAPRPVALVVTRTFKSEGNDLNPLLSPRNYKTPTSIEVKRTWEVASYPNPVDSTYYPAVD